MNTNQWIILSVFLLLSIVTTQCTDTERHLQGHGHHGHHGHGTGSVDANHAQCNQAQQFLNQWWPQSVLNIAFQKLCAQVGATQAWSLLQGFLGISVTGVLDQATFQALLNNTNHVLLAQQLLSSTTAPLNG